MGGKKVFELGLEVGFKSQPLKEPLPNGYTHKWQIFVRGVNNNNIEHCIKRVAFQLHESFPQPYREISVPPYQVRETGYAGFVIPVEVYYKNKDKTNNPQLIELDLQLNLESPMSDFKIEKVLFTNPTKDFERCLIKSGAQLLPVSKEKRKRSDSPPIKKQKSSSLIPSKDMCKPAAPTNTNQSSNFIDVFGAPLNYKNSSHHKSHDHHHKHHHKHHHHSKHKNEIQPASQQAQQKSSQPTSQKPPQPTPHKTPQQAVQKAPQKPDQPLFAQPDPLMSIYNKITSLSDCDRLQKIVDIIDESGEWFNLTSNKFEFDLKRLDKKTLSRIEKCLQL